MHKYSAKIVIRKDGVRKDGLSPILLQVFINTKRKRIPIGVYAELKKFNTKSGKVNGRGESVDKTNAIIHKAMSDANNIFKSAIMEGESLTVDRFMDYFENRAAQEDFIIWVEAEIAQNRATKTKAESTCKNDEKVLRRLRVMREEIKFFEINYELIQEYNGLLKKEGKAPNTIASMHKSFKALVNVAIKKGKNIKNPYEHFPISWAKTDRVFLTVKELKSLLELYDSNDLNVELHRVLRYFLFMCFTSLRVGDLMILRRDQIIGNNLVFRPAKTKNSRMIINIPLNKRAKRLIAESDALGDTIFDCVTNKQINVDLKQIAAYAGIKKNISCHTGRHTFGTTFLRLGGKVEVLQKIMGHSKIETTMIYVHITEEQREEQMGNFDLEF